jgi:carbon-monoxide dehydrogenase small subunit
MKKHTTGGKRPRRTHGATPRRVRSVRGKSTTPRLVDRKEITVQINGSTHVATVDVRTTLVDFIREQVGLTGTHVGCEHGVCGACTILLDREPVRSCLLFAVQADGAEIATVESLGSPDHLHPVQEAFRDHHGLQCGFCTPGFLMTTMALLHDRPAPSEAEIRSALSGNLCRCTGYQGIVEAVLDAAQRLRTQAHL